MWLSRILSLAAALVGIWYFLWRADTVSGTGVIGGALFVAELLSYVFLLLTLVLFWTVSSREGPQHAPSGTLDVFIPVAGEPLEMVERTLQAALAIEHPHDTYILNDGFVSASDNWQAVEKLARSYGIRCFTRHEGSPSKAENLNHAFSQTDGDFIAVIDADHRARPFFAHETLGYFVDDRVGFVTTPQRFDLDQEDLLGNEERLFYAFMQSAKDADNGAFSCGNAVIYRRAALNDIDGFSEWNIVEDVHTSMEMHDRGWSSVYHPRPVTVGEAPTTGAALAKQRQGWATDSIRMFLWDNPLFRDGMSFMQRLHYFHTGFFYIVMLAQLIFVGGPIVHVLFGIEVLNAASVGDYILHSAPYLGTVALLLVTQGGIKGALRATQKVVFLSPTFLVATVKAAVGRNLSSPITSKSRQRSFSWVLLPHYIAFGLLVMTVALALLFPGPGRAVSAFWAAWLAAAFAIPIVTVGHKTLSRVLRVAIRGGVTIGAGFAVAVAVGFRPAWLTELLPGVTREGDLRRSDFAVPLAPRDIEVPRNAEDDRQQRPNVPQELVPPSRGAYLGAFTADIVEPGAIDRWERRNGADLGMALWYQQWRGDTSDMEISSLDRVREQGALPVVTWEPWDKPPGTVHDRTQRRFRLSRITSGAFDDYIRSWARDAARYRHPILIRFAHEMNGDWYPWSVNTNRNSKRDYVRAWRHVHRIFQEEGATNVSWVWSINELTALDQDLDDIRDIYPGDRFVDWVSVSGFNWGKVNAFNRWRTFDDVFGGSLRALKRFDKPILIAEIGTEDAGGNATAWIRNAVRSIHNDHPEVQAVVWYDDNYQGRADFRLSSSKARALSDATNRPYWSPEIRTRNAATTERRP